MKRISTTILIILLGFLVLFYYGCDIKSIANLACIPVGNNSIFWVEKNGYFYTNDLARAQDKVPFTIILPSYIPSNEKVKSTLLIEGPLVQSDNTAKVSIGYEVHVNGPDPSDIRVTETSWQSWHPERQGLRTSLVNIDDKQVTKTEIDHPLGPGTLFGFNSADVYFFVEIYNLSPDETIKIVESIIEQID